MFRKLKNLHPTKQVIGKNKLALYPKSIAEFLKLPDAATYTGHCFRRTAATLIGDFGLDVTDLQRAGGWSSSTVASSYIAESTSQKIKIASAIAGSSQAASSTEMKTSNTSMNNNLSIDFGSATVCFQFFYTRLSWIIFSKIKNVHFYTANTKNNVCIKRNSGFSLPVKCCHARVLSLPSLSLGHDNYNPDLATARSGRRILHPRFARVQNTTGTEKPRFRP